MSDISRAYEVVAEALLLGFEVGGIVQANAVQTLALTPPAKSEQAIADQANGNEPMEMLGRVAAGRFDSQTLAWVQRGMAAYMRAGGAIQFELCLHLPNTPVRRRLMQRNAWLAEAAKHVAKTTPWLGAVELSAELDSFLCRGPWSAWRHLSGPPSDASRLRTALYHVAKANEGKSLSAKQIYRVMGHE